MTTLETPLLSPVMQRRVDPDKFAIVAVGKTEDWDGDLTAFGPVEELDISIPEPEGPEFPDPTPETIEKGQRQPDLPQAATDKALGRLDRLVEPGMLQHLPLFNPELLHDAGDAVGTEQTHEVVFKGDMEGAVE